MVIVKEIEKFITAVGFKREAKKKKTRGELVRTCKSQNGITTRFDLVVGVQCKVDQGAHGTALDDLDLGRHGGRQVGQTQGGVALAVELAAVDGAHERRQRPFFDEHLEERREQNRAERNRGKGWKTKEEIDK
jgi:hypothetical protein